MPYLKRDAPCPEPLDCRILTAALDLFVENGYHNVSVHEVQKRAQVSIGSIYNHFGGKEGIARALYEHLLNELDELIDGVVATVESPAAQCREIIRQLFAHTETHRNIIAFLFHAKHTEFLRDDTLICEARPFVRIRGIVVDAMKKGELRKTDAWVATSAMFGGAVRMIQLRLDGLLAQPLPDYFEAVIESAWSGVAENTEHHMKTKSRVAKY